MLKHFIVARLVEGTKRCGYLFLDVARHYDPVLSAKHAGMIIAEHVAPRLHDQLAGYQ